LQKVGPSEGDWAALAYLWNADQSEATAAPYGAIDAHGTAHNVPAAAECMACHGGTRSRVLGFSAIQLGVERPPGELDLGELLRSQRLSDPPAYEQIDLPGTSTVQAALGYLHANCSHCHNDQRPHHDGARCFDPENEVHFKLLVAELATPDQTETYRSTHHVLKPGHPGQSRLIDLVSQRGFFKQMPPLATKKVDHDAVELLRRWVLELGEGP
jgi:hypothetical protein